MVEVVVEASSDVTEWSPNDEAVSEGKDASFLIRFDSLDPIVLVSPAPITPEIELTKQRIFQC